MLPIQTDLIRLNRWEMFGSPFIANGTSMNACTRERIKWKPALRSFLNVVTGKGNICLTNFIRRILLITYTNVQPYTIQISISKGKK